MVIRAVPEPVRDISHRVWVRVETADLIDLIITSKIVPDELGARLKAHSDRSQALLVGLLKRRRPRT